MPKRKSNGSPASLGSLDAALDLLVCETFARLDSVASRWEQAAEVKLNPGVLQGRWEEAVKRYWCMKSMDELCCTAGASSSKASADGDMPLVNGDQEMPAADKEARDENGRPLPDSHPGAVERHRLCPEEADEWRRWTPKTNDVVLVELEDGKIWPGKIINKTTFFQGRTVPRGHHFFPVRIYSEGIEPTVTVKSRLLPLHMRPEPPLLAPTALISAYHHAANPSSFDQQAAAREAQAAHERVHPAIVDEASLQRIKKEKEDWNKVVNWVMNERRAEKLRNLSEERARRLREVAQDKDEGAAAAPDSLPDDFCPKKRKTVRLPDASTPNGHRHGNGNGDGSDGAGYSRSTSPASSIFGPIVTSSQNGPRREGTPAVNHIRPRLSTPPRPSSPRRTDRRRNGIFSGMGELSPHARTTWTPPRILPSGDETAVGSHAATAASASASGSAPSGAFDFVSPLGPVSRGRLTHPDPPVRRGSLEVVKEEADEEDGWTVVTKRSREKRAGSAPAPAEKGPTQSQEGMDES